MDIFGHTRSHVTSDYALITPDTHVASPLVGWNQATAVIHIAPPVGARFLQYTATLAAGASSAGPGRGVERFIYVHRGQCQLELGGLHNLGQGGFAFVPADTDHQLTCDHNATLIVLEKRFQPHPDLPPPQPRIGDQSTIQGEPFLGDPDAKLQTLLPVAPEFDMAVNLFTYQPGATLPQVEIHTMEHGLIMLSGQGVYRLSRDYHPVTAGDVIWMKSFCPQWFVAMGKSPATYLYYKDIHRDQV